MPRTTTAAGLLICLTGLTSALAPAPADAAQATFAVKLEAKRTVAWDQPRTQLNGDCNGWTYVQGRGGEEFELTSLPGGRLVVEGNGRRLSSWSFGTEGKRRTLSSEPPEAKGMITRSREWVTGTTGGWCGDAKRDPAKPNDCGTRLPPFTFRVTMADGLIGVRETRGFSPRENYHFRDCNLIAPQGVPNDSLPSLDVKLPLKKLFNKRESTIPIKGAQKYGPQVTRMPGGVNRTTSAQYDWKLTLTRVKNLTPRSENG